MPRYFFDIADQGRGEPDTDGSIHTDAEEARKEAICTLAHMAKDELPDGNAHDFTASVRDESGKVFFRAALSLRAEWLA
ncbi:DUF6894 family protein [uncultured Methylobacterium sp.]|uniref:DUF6894 family protein n=1 Tax=uncultured Methylobacterium sp. TaxID=157278 RepID=UPI0035C9B3CF